jgi:hypothetical protein
VDKTAEAMCIFKAPYTKPKPWNGMNSMGDATMFDLNQRFKVF